MKNKKIRRISIVMSLLLLFNNLGMFASDSISQDEVFDSSLTEQTENVVRNSSNIQARMGKYYSHYDDATYYDSTTKLQLRANCYGYAFRLFYAPDEFYNYPWYKQRPGEFASKSTSNPLYIYENNAGSYGDQLRDINNMSDLVDFYWDVLYTDSSYENRAFYLKQLLIADATALGYTVTEYTGSTIPDATTNPNKRLIAAIAGDGDYHFYMQHSDNTWSHKRGANVPQTTCIECEMELTNNNIRSHACESEGYANAVVKFYYITKNSIVDFKHRNGATDTSTITRIIPTDNAGNHRYAANVLDDFPEDYLAGNLDYPGDIDYYSIYAPRTETRTVTVDTSTSYSIKLQIYREGTLIASQIATSDVSVTVDFEVDTQYYILISSTNYNQYSFGVSYTLE